MSTLTFAPANRERRVATTGTTAPRGESRKRRRATCGGVAILALRDIGCTCREGVVTLRGCLPTYDFKQIAQHVVSELEGVCGIINQIEVLAPSGRAEVGSRACASAKVSEEPTPLQWQWRNRVRPW